MLHPARYTKPLSEDFTSEADWFLPVAELAWKVAYGKDYEFDEWQKWLIRSILETNPDGSLRYRQVLCSLPRQNGKTEVMSVIGLWSLLRKAGVTNLGVASTADQARLVHERLLRTIQANPTLAKFMNKITDTRGIVTKEGSKYIIRASNSGTLQGIPVEVGIVDELHLVDPDVYNAIVAGTGSRKGTMVLGITTAGDDNSDLLHSLYENAEKAIGGQIDGFGAFIWEASEATVPTNDDDLLKLLLEANPALESGRIDPVVMLQDVRTMPDQDIIRYRLNRFTEAAGAFMPLSLWATCARGMDEEFPRGTIRPIFSIDRTPDWGYATIVATVKDDKGITHTEVVASITKPTLEQLVNICINLYKYSPMTYIMDGYGLKELGAELKMRGLPTYVTGQGEIINASAMFYAKTVQKKIRHASDPLMSVQLPRTVRKNIGDAFRISRKDSSVEIDAVMATLLGVFGAEIRKPHPVQVF
jgi:phage terminase large subunit-like protein